MNSGVRRPSASSSGSWNVGQAQARKRRIFTIIGAAVAADRGDRRRGGHRRLTKRDSGDQTASAATTTTTATTSAAADPAAPQSTPPLPPFAAPADLGADCQYPATPEPASKQVNPPRTGKVPTDPAQVSASMATNQGNIGLQLDNGKSPCTVNSFASLAQQGYFNDTPCHRLTTTEGLAVLQCGDPTGQGTGGPGYQFANEYPTNQYQPDDPAAAAAGGVPARHAGDGQRRARHQRQPVLPGVSGFGAAAELHGVRHHRRDGAGHAGQDRRGRGGRWRPGRQAGHRCHDQVDRSWTDAA